MGGMWHSLVDLGVPYVEKIIRTVLVYSSLLLLLRIVGKRGIAQLNEFDLVVMLLLSNVVQNAIIGPDNSLVGGIFGAAVLLVNNLVVLRYLTRLKWVRWLFEGKPAVLIDHGHYDYQNWRRQGMRRGDLELAIREQGGDGLSEAENVVLAPSGAVLVELKIGDQPADKNDVASLAHRLGGIEQRLAAMESR
jgi:uncharacterized membrane protein YcaP (DUF421 family)